MKWHLNHGTATAIQIPSGDFLVFHIQRAAGAPPFHRRDHDLLDSFRPNLARAGLLAARSRFERLRAAAEALALVGLPAVVLDRTGRALAANRLIEALPDYLHWLPGDRIALTDPCANELLLSALNSLVNPAFGSVRSFPTRSARGAAGAVVHLIPTPGKARDLFDGGYGVVVLPPVTAPEAPDIALIRGLFDLTASEARVARGITRGLTLDEIAAQYGVERETIRSQIKAVFAKTGARRQAEVAALLSGLTKIPIRIHDA